MVGTSPEAHFEPPARVLVVDDEVDMLDLARMLLEPKGYRVDTATDGLQGLAAAQAVAYDVIVLDITMPHMDGIELGNALRADPATRGSMIIVHSGLNEAWVRSFLADFDLFLAKPADSGRLAASVDQLLRKRRESTAAAKPQDH